MSPEFSITMPDRDYDVIKRLSEEGNVLVNKKNFEGALKKFNQALDVLPTPKNNWEAAFWLYASIGDIFLFKEEYQNASNNFYNALNCPGGQESGFVHMRLGESLYELGDNKSALNHLLLAYIIEGGEIFSEEEEKYFEFLKNNVEL